MHQYVIQWPVVSDREVSQFRRGTDTRLRRDIDDRIDATCYTISVWFFKICLTFPLKYPDKQLKFSLPIQLL